MDKNYEISDVKNKSSEFKYYLYSRLDSQVIELLDYLKSRTKVYIFSGIIRDYFLDNDSIRDLDIVLGENTDFHFIAKYLYPMIDVQMNNFGGYKIIINSFRIDIWSIENTWGIINERKSATKHSLINSAFFNFSAILYDLNEEEFYCNDIFIDFLNIEEIDIVYEKNPNIPLCFINALYYKNRLSMPLSAKLKRWIKTNFSPNLDFKGVQKRHFGKIIFEDKDIFEFLIFCALDTKQ